MNADPIVALVTGGARRIGRTIVEDLAANGFSVAIHYNRSRKDAAELADALTARCVKACVVEADLSDREAAGGLIKQVQTVLGSVRLLVNNASMFEDDDVSNFNGEGWDRHLAVNLEAPVILTRTMARHLPPQADGLAVNLIDQRVWRLTPRFFSYTLSKSALWTATQTMAQALAPRVRVNAIGPGPTLASARQDAAGFQAQTDALLLKRGPELPEFGATIRWLWNAKSVTGQMVALDGGQHLAWETPDVVGVNE